MVGSLGPRASEIAHDARAREEWQRRCLCPRNWGRGIIRATAPPLVRPGAEEVVMRGRRVWAGSLAVLLGSGLGGGRGVGPAGAEPPSDRPGPAPVAGSVERTGRVWRNVSGGRVPHVRGAHGSVPVVLGRATTSVSSGWVTPPIGWSRPGSAPTPTGRGWSAGGYHTCGVRTDRSLWCWGDNDVGQLGLGDTDRSAGPDPGRHRRRLGAGDGGLDAHVRGPHRSVAVVLGQQRLRAARAG